MFGAAVNAVEHRFGIKITLITASLWQFGTLPALIG